MWLSHESLGLPLVFYESVDSSVRQPYRVFEYYVIQFSFSVFPTRSLPGSIRRVFFCDFKGFDEPLDFDMGGVCVLWYSDGAS